MLQRPTAKELLRSKFIKKAGKTSFLTDLIDNYRNWKLTSNDEDSDSDDDDNDL